MADSLTYNPTTGNWEASSSNPSSDKNNSGSSSNKKPSTSKNDNSSSNVDSELEAEKEFIEVEFNILTGEMQLTPTTKSIRIKVNDTVEVRGLGRYLSGLYFVSAVNRNLSTSGGYTHSITLLKNGFGDSLKNPKNETRKVEVPKTAPEYTVGDTVRIVGADAVYSNAHDGVKVPEWVKKKDLTIKKFSDDKTRVLLMPINSWTYIKYIQKV